MLRILLFSPKGAGSHYYGPGMSAYRMYNKLDNKSVSLSLAHGYSGQKKVDGFKQQYFISDIDNKSLLSGIKFFLNAKRWIKQNAHHFDVVHCLGAFHYSFMMSLWFERIGIPAIIKITGSKGMGFRESSLLSTFLGLKKYRIKHANHIAGYISISSKISRNLIEAGINPEKIHFIPNGVNINRFKPLNETEKKKQKKKLGIPNKDTVIFTGSFTSNKNPYLIVRSFKELSFPFRDSIQLVLIGPDRDGGEQRDQIKKFIQKEKLKNIILKDFVKDIELYCQVSDLFVQPSSHEGLSNSLLEAQACGLPAIVTRISGSEDVVDENVNGKFVDSNPKSIAKAIEEYFSNRKRLSIHSKGAREVIVSRYDSNTILQKHLDLFSSLVR